MVRNIQWSGIYNGQEYTIVRNIQWSGIYIWSKKEDKGTNNVLQNKTQNGTT